MLPVSVKFPMTVSTTAKSTKNEKGTIPISTKGHIQQKTFNNL